MKRVYPWVPVPWGVMVRGPESIPQDALHPVRRGAARRDLWCAEADGRDFASTPLREVDNHDFGVQLREKFDM